MNAKEFLKAGKLSDAIKALSDEVRQNPSDPQRRTFLFELLCFAGEYERAEKQLDVLAQGGQHAELGTMLYRAALRAERDRADLFASGNYVSMNEAPAEPVGGVVNGHKFSAISDADPRVGARLEVFLAGRYLLVPFAHVASIEIRAPKQLRDLLWAPALVRTAPAFKGFDLGEVLFPALSPKSSQHPDEQVRLGRVTMWEPDASGRAVPFGQRSLFADDEEIPLLEVRQVEFTPVSSIAIAS